MTRNTAETIVAKGDADLVTFGRYFISNPDLPERIRRSIRTNKFDWHQVAGKHAYSSLGPWWCVVGL
jgi:2,4-dienoyl-CoA reductase-like NADH-dependent reductase (Old Yellow Enzyme family)